ncbi:hypothetical protein EON63_14050, partial [archaeon]
MSTNHPPGGVRGAGSSERALLMHHMCVASQPLAYKKTVEQDEKFEKHHTIPYTIYHIPYTIYHIPYTIYHTPYTIYHIPYTIYHIPYTIYLTSYIIH